ncbi:GPW/gp25 family protein [Levilactobacillus enshiensis]|uniref:hypothetical protein n=1 Tax=Levilactobacillus enshiensis TaxID=2590213 RepID=UPI00117AA685|nr:hypothetical protein [Levilactobacillus enshiensis]
MKRDFELNSNGDVVIADGDISTVSASDEMNQRIRTTLQTRLDEFEPEDGPMGLTRENALGKAYNEDFLREDIEDVITEQVDERIDIREINFDKDEALRTLTVEIKYVLPNDDDVQTVSTNLGDDG